MGQLEGSEDQLEGFEGQSEDNQGQPEGPDGHPGGRTDGRKDIQTEVLSTLQDFVP